MSAAAPILKQPWRTLSRQKEAATFGIWVFLASEALFFGSLLLVYTVARISYPQDFLLAGRETDIWFGTINTAILMTSSLTMAVASQTADVDARKLTVWCLTATIALGILFLILKGFEYKEDLDKHLWPSTDFALKEPGARIFFALYWTLTGVHAIHLTIGLFLVGRLAIFGGFRWVRLKRNPQVEVTALYWHLVDVIWIILYPLIYLMGRA